MKETINIALAFDNNYLPYAYVALYSIFQNNQSDFIVTYILQYDLTEESRSILIELAEKFENQLVFLDIDRDDIDKQLPSIGRWSAEACFRLLIPSIVPESVDRILYLDSDIIVTSSIHDLYFTPLENYDLAACYDLNIAHTSDDVFLSKRNVAFADSFHNKSYINSGVLLYNLKKLRGFTLDVYLNAAKELEYKIFAPDQDLINYVHAKNILLLDPRKYNYPPYIAFLEGKLSDELKSNATILHYVGEKPWTGGDHAHFPTESIWWDYALSTLFKDSLTQEYIYNSINDMKMFDCMQGIDTIRDQLYNENILLKKELKNVSEQVKQLIANFK